MNQEQKAVRKVHFSRARFRVVKAVHFTRAPKKYEKIGAPKFGKIKLLITVIVALFFREVDFSELEARSKVK